MCRSKEDTDTYLAKASLGLQWDPLSSRIRILHMSDGDMDSRASAESLAVLRGELQSPVPLYRSRVCIPSLQSGRDAHFIQR